jgi:GNAT superfamily N-acetyltransferase
MTTIAPPRDAESVRFPDDSTIELRPLGIGDGRLISSFLSQLSPESEYRRFLSAGGGVRSQWIASLIKADQHDCLVHGAVAINEFGSSLVAIAESIRDPGDPRRAEFALAAVDPWQNMGIGTLLTRHVARIARSTGVGFWETYMLAENTGMAKVMDHVGIRVEYTMHMGVASVVHELVARC